MAFGNYCWLSPQLSWDNMWWISSQTRQPSPGVVSAALRGLPQASSGSSLRSPPQASPRSFSRKGNRGWSPYIMCRSLSRIFMQIFHSFSSRAVGAVFVATSLRHFAPVPPGVVSAASAELPPGFLPGVVGPSSDSVFFCKTLAGLGRTVGK